MTKIGFVFVMMTVLFLMVAAFAIVVCAQFHNVQMRDGATAIFLNVVATMWLVSFVAHVYESFTLRPILR